MRLVLKNILFGFLYGFMAIASAASETDRWFHKDTNNQVILKVDLFISSTCPHCSKADQFFKDLEAHNKWIEIHRYVINQDKSALETYNQFLQMEEIRDFAVPATFFCNTRWVGFDSAETSGIQLLKNMKLCRTQIAKTGYLSPATEQLLGQESSANWFQENIRSSKSLSVPMLVVMAFVDALDPCVSFIVLTLFSFLIIQKKRKYQITILILFLAGVGFSQHIQQMHTVLYYQALDVLRVPALMTGLGLLAYVFYRHPVILAKKGNRLPLASMLLVFLTAFVVQTYQQVHTPNFSLIAHKLILSGEPVVLWQMVWHLLFQLIYVLVIGLLAFFLAALIKYYGRWSKHQLLVREFAWHYLVVIALILMGFPYLFAKLLFSFLVFLLALLSSWISFRKWGTRLA